MCGPFRVIAVALAAIVGGAVPCSAGGLVIEAPSLMAKPGSSGSFDLLLMNTNLTGGTSYDVSSDQFVLSLLGPLGITFTGVSIATDPVAAPYIFVSSGTTQPGGPPLSTDTFPNTTFTGADAEFASPYYRTVNPGQTFGLAHVSYAVSSSTPSGTIAIHPIPDQLAHRSGRHPDLFRYHQWLDRGRDSGSRTLGADPGLNRRPHRTGAGLVAPAGAGVGAAGDVIGSTTPPQDRPGGAPDRTG